VEWGPLITAKRGIVQGGIQFISRQIEADLRTHEIAARDSLAPAVRPGAPDRARKL